VDSRAGEIANLAHAYRVLDVPHDATARAIKSSYRKLVKRWHPDRYKAGSTEHREATEMSALLNAAYARVQDAPLRPGYATPFSTPRNQPIDPDAPHKPQQATTADDSAWSREEYGHRRAGISDADFILIREYARRIGAKEDAAKPSYRIGTYIQVALGATCGAVMGIVVNSEAYLGNYGDNDRMPTRFSDRTALVQALAGALIVGLMVWIDRHRSST
jgi:curved DNA-binding protein CbpA